MQNPVPLPPSRMRAILAVAGLLSALLATWAMACPAQAQARLPFRHHDRPLTLSRATLRADAGLTFRSVHQGPDSRQNSLFMALGLGAGVTDDVELGAVLVPLRLTPDFDYLDPSVYGLVRLLPGQIEIGFHIAFTLPVDNETRMRLGVPFLIRAGDVLRIDAGFYLDTDFDDADGFIPAVFAFQLSPPIALGIETGLSIPDAGIPLGMFLSYTIGRRTPSTDIRMGFRLPDVVDVGFDVWEAYLAANVFVFL